MARPDLTNEEVEQMGRDNPGSAAEYLRLRREELEAEKQAEREADDEARWIEAFVAAGGDRAEAKKARRAALNEQATWAAALQDEDAVEQSRRHIARAL